MHQDHLPILEGRMLHRGKVGQGLRQEVLLQPGPDGKDALCMDEVGVAQVVKTAFREDLRSSLEPDGLAELDTILLEDLGEDAPEGTEHGPPAVDDFKLTVLGERLGVCRQTSSVPAIVTGEFTSQVGRGLLRERAQVFRAVRSVPVDKIASSLG